MSGKYSELRRIDNSLNNFKLSIQHNLIKLGFEGDLNSIGQSYEFLQERVFNANISKKPKLGEDTKNSLASLFENMWVNESYVKNSLENVFNSKKFDHHYFYLVYISFYYSLFTSISIVLRSFEPSIKKESHSKKINNFNNKIITNKFLKECYFKPFSLVIFDEEVKNLETAFPKIANNENLKELEKAISNYEIYCEQCTVTGERVINEDIYTLRIAKSLMKYYIESHNKSDGVSYIHYFMSKRHFLHYNASFIYDIETKYHLDALLENIKNNMIYILNIANFITESIFIRITGTDDFKNVFNDFDTCLINCIGKSLEEDDYFHQFENLTTRALFHDIY